MKVLHVIPSVSVKAGGPSEAIFPMCRALREQGIDLLLATTDGGLEVSSFKSQVSASSSTRDAGSGQVRDTQTIQTVPTIFFPSQLGTSFKYSRPFAQWLDEHVADYDLVHIHAVFNHACIAAARACREKRVPYIVRPLGTLDPWSMKQKRLRKKIFWHGGIKALMAGAAAIHYTSTSEQRAVEESLKLNHGIVVPLGVEVRPDEALDLPAESTATFTTGSPYVLVLSRLLPTKGLDVLLDAFLSLSERKEFEGWRLVLAGEGPSDYVKSIKQRVEQQHANELVSFPGWLSGKKKAAALCNASLLALPSQHENFGLCVMEALAGGVPVLISPHVNLAMEVEEARAGWIAAVDKSSLQAALAEALSSEDERKRRGQAGRKLAMAFSWPTVARRLKECYELVLAAKN